MNNSRVSFRKSHASLALFIGLALTTFEKPLAGNLAPGESAVVEPGDTAEAWTLNNAQLDVNAGAETQRIAAVQGSNVIVTGGTVTADSASAINLVDSNAVIKDSTVVSTVYYGLEALTDRTNPGSGSKVSVSNSTITGEQRGVSASFNSVVDLDNTAVYGNGSGTDAGPSGGVGIVMVGATVNLTNGSSATGSNYGVLMGSDIFENSNKSSLNLDHSAVIGETGSAIIVTAGNTPDTDATININNGSTLTGGNGVILEVEKASTATFNVTNSQLIGDVLVSDDSFAHLSLANSASLTGTITNATSLNIDGTSAWTMTGDSSVGTLGLAGALVDLRNGDNTAFHQLNVGELSGSGTFALGIDLAAHQGDRLNVNGTATGNHNLLVNNTGAEPVASDADQTLVHVDSGDAAFSVIGGTVDAGAFSYELQELADGSGGTDWSLVQTKEVSAASRSVIGLFSAAPTVWYGETTTLRSRMGEVRNGQAEGGGWMRAYGNKFNMSAGADVAYSQQQQGISFGADAPMKTSSGQWLVGLMGGYSKSDLDLKEGTTGAVDSYYVGAYSTWLAEDGFYVDALIKANRFQNSSDVVMRDGQKSKGKYTNHGVGASVEAGKHIKLNEEWFVEPYAQVTGLWVSGQDYHLDNGMDASSNKADSLLGKVGTSVGRKFALKDGGFVQPYVKVAAAHEFVTSNQVSINGNRFNNDLSGTRAELGAGVAAQVTEKLQLHADFDYMKGNNIEQPWGVNVGLRYNW